MGMPENRKPDFLNRGMEAWRLRRSRPSRPCSRPWLDCGALLGAVIIAAMGGVTATAGAQGSGNGFLFQAPSGSVTLSGGYARASASGDLFSFATDQLTLNRSDFSGPLVGLDVALRIAPRFDVVIGAAYSATSTPSSYRKYVDQNNAEIRQTTNFSRLPIMLSVKAYLTPPGRTVGRFAWVPSRFATYVGAGGGAMLYRFDQKGDFVDYQDSNSVFTGEFTSSRWAPAAQGFVGADFSLSPHIALTGEAKYIWARGSLDQSFSGFDRIDLSGFTTTLGLTLRF